jgi:aminoglycoside phosphotransferase (APT) family kinase protein
MLDLADIPKYLMDRNLLGPEAVVDGQLQVVDASRLNRVFVVTAEQEQGFVLKLTGEVGDAGVAHEAAVLERLRAVDPDGKLASWLPEVVSYDPGEGALVLEATPGARDLGRHHQRGRFSVILAHAAGRALGMLHSLPTAALGLPTSIDSDWRRALHRPDLASVNDSSTGALDLIRLVQRSAELCSRLDELDASSSVESVIHGDVRWDNCLAIRSRGSGSWRRLLLIDWEMAGPGDPAWDVGAFFGEYLRAWLWSIPDLDPRKGRLDPGHARFRLVRMQPAVRGFWDAYVRHRGRSTADLSPTLRRATSFAAVRLLNGALEEAQMLSGLHTTMISAVHLSHAVLRRPDEAAAQLLGLRASWAPP